MRVPKTATGALFIVAARQFTLCIIIAEATYPGYNVYANYISDLGVGPSATTFNASVFTQGLLTLVATLPPDTTKTRKP